MRLGVVWESNSNAHYRAIDPMKAMERRGHDVVWPADGKGAPDLSRLGGCNLVHVYRRCDNGTLGVLARLARSGTAITWDTDDDLTAIPKESPVYKKTGGMAAQRIFAQKVKAARLARCVTTTNDLLAEKYRGAGIERVEAIGNTWRPGSLDSLAATTVWWSVGSRGWSTGLTWPGSPWRTRCGG
jgi:hypothetical protein